MQASIAEGVGPAAQGAGSLALEGFALGMGERGVDRNLVATADEILLGTIVEDVSCDAEVRRESLDIG